MLWPIGRRKINFLKCQRKYSTAASNSVWIVPIGIQTSSLDLAGVNYAAAQLENSIYPVPYVLISPHAGLVFRLLTRRAVFHNFITRVAKRRNYFTFSILHVIHQNYFVPNVITHSTHIYGSIVWSGDQFCLGYLFHFFRIIIFRCVSLRTDIP